MTTDLLAIGEAMAEIRQDQDVGFAVSYAGDTYNTAIYAARSLDSSGSVAYMTRIGEDPLSMSFVATARQEGLITDYIDTDSDRNIGIYAVSTDSSGERSFSYWRNESAARLLFSIEPIELPSARIIYLSGITLAILPPGIRENLMAKLRTIKASGQSLVAFDSNFRPALWENTEVARSTLSGMWEIADIALPSIDDELALFGEPDEDAVIERFASMSLTACAIKRGSLGPLSTTLAATELPEFVVADKVVDTTGAGDSFNGGYLAAWLQGLSEKDCLLRAHAVASHVVGVRGAIALRNI